MIISSCFAFRRAMSAAVRPAAGLVARVTSGHCSGQRFLIGIICPHMNRFAGVFPLVIAGYHNDFCCRIMPEHFLKTPEPFFGPVLIRRQAQVQGRDPRVILFEQGECFHPVPG